MLLHVSPDKSHDALVLALSDAGMIVGAGLLDIGNLLQRITRIAIQDHGHVNDVVANAHLFILSGIRVAALIICHGFSEIFVMQIGTIMQRFSI